PAAARALGGGRWQPQHGAVARHGLCSRPYQSNSSFDPEYIMSKSTAAAGLCSWCLNIVRFYGVYCEVEPKRLALEE
ncbi:DYH17 protein, partial [Alcedo cyanopectus]|nr:DYH17 protein [Ceyx cyanopectus]